MKSGDVLIHRLSGTFAELVESTVGYHLVFTIRGFVSQTRAYQLNEIVVNWRLANDKEMLIYHKGKVSIK